MEVLKSNNTQFIIPTHLPVLMGLPGTCIYEIKETGMQPVNCKGIDHYRITKKFFRQPPLLPEAFVKFISKLLDY